MLLSRCTAVNDASSHPGRRNANTTKKGMSEDNDSIRGHLENILIQDRLFEMSQGHREARVEKDRAEEILHQIKSYNQKFEKKKEDNTSPKKDEKDEKAKGKAT